MENKIKIASQTGCKHCYGTGVRENYPFYFETCLWCAGTGQTDNKEENTKWLERESVKKRNGVR